MNKLRNNQQGFTLIELMIVVAIIGILASVAISSYQTYSIRAQVTEGIVLAGNAKVPIVDAFLNLGEAPANRAQAGLTDDPADSGTKYVQQLAINNGRVDVMFGNEANAEITDEILSLTPYETADGSVVWRCGDAPAPLSSGNSLSPMGTAGGGNTAAYQSSTVAPRYMPSTCR